MPSLRPQEARLDRDDLLVVTWSDGAALHYPADHVRAHCPCAHCTKDAGDDRDARLAQHATVRYDAVEEVGNYALRLGFDDGHQLGIYTFDHLRTLGFSAEHSPESFEV